MSYLSDVNSETSAEGVNTDYTISGGNWSGDTYTGAGELTEFEYVVTSLQTDEDGTLFYDFSVDGTNWTTFPTNGFAISAGIHAYHSAHKGAFRYFRPRYVGDGGRSYFRLKTQYTNTQVQLNAPLNQAVATDADAINVRGDDFQEEVANGRRSGVVKWTKWGANTDVDSAAAEVVAPFGGTFTPLESAETFEIAYNDSTDGADGGATGAKVLTIWYIDANGLPRITTHTLGSSSPDTTAFSGFGINRMAVSSSGSSNFNVNDITVTATTAGTNQSMIVAGQSVTKQAIHFVGSNHIAVGNSATINIARLSGSAPRVTIRMFVFNRGITTKFDIFDMLMDTSVENTHYVNEFEGFVLNSTDVAWFEATTNTNDTPVNIRISLNEYQKR